MKRFARRSVIGAVTVLACGLGVGTAASAQQQQQQQSSAAAAAGTVNERNIQPAFTLPIKEYKISFPSMGVIKEVKVKEGDVVKKGDVLMKQDDSEDQAELRVLEAAIKQSKGGIVVGQAKLKVAESDYKSKSAMLAKGAFNKSEVERAEAERDVAAAQIEQAKDEVAQTEAKRDKQATHVTNMTLKSDVDGVVKELINDVGSNVDPTRPVLMIVDNQALLVEVQVPAQASLSLKKGDRMRVSYDRKNWREASVAFMSPQADAQSGMRMIRLELPNPQGEPSGLQAFVELPDKLLATADAK
jgi:RND family efflux transporter MFP subunit